MSNTVFGIFEYTSEAQAAKEYLLKNGFADSDVDIETQSAETVTGNAGTYDNDRVGNFFSNLFSDDDDQARTYTNAGRRGTIVTVHTRSADEAEAAARVLDNYGAVNVDEYAEKFRSTDSAYTSQSAMSGTLENDQDSIKVIQEELQVGKREVQTGGVRLRSRIVERPVEENIRLRQEYVSVERTPVNRVATEADFDAFKEGTIEVTEHAEVPVVSKEARVVEEVSLRKEIDEKEETIRDTVRNTEVETEDLTNEESLRKSGFDL